MIFFTLLIGVSTALNAAPEVLQSALSNPTAFRALFSEYQAAEGRNYVRGEMRMRASIFRANIQEIAAHDAEKASYTGFNSSAIEENADEEVLPQWGNPSEKDWRGVAVTKVKNQGRCGSCWIFSGFGALEGHYKTQGSILKSFAEQEGLDCIQRNGCNGGYMAKVFDWLKRSGRVGATKDIRYTARQGSCRYSSKPNALIAFRVTGYSNARGDSAHVTALATSGPLSVGYSVASDFMRYKGGIYKRGYCSGGDHAVTSVGYTKDYFRMKNSWGSGWGEGGYFRIGRGNVCGITNMGFAPRFQSTGKKDDGQDEGGDDVNPTKDDGGDGDCQDGFKKCPDGSCVHEHWHC